MKKSILYVVHCVDTEGPLFESTAETIKRFNNIYNKKLAPTIVNLRKIQNKEIELGGNEDSAAKCFSEELLNYNSNWQEVDLMLDYIMSKDFRNTLIDDYGNGWVYSWHCLDHLDLKSNPRKKAVGYGEVFNHYRKRLIREEVCSDELNWHFHPLSIKKEPLAAATSYTGNYDLLNHVLARRIIDDHYFPTVNRPGFHSERADSNAFLENWIPFDYANQRYDFSDNQPDMANNRFGDWSRAPTTWRGYHPSFHDYQSHGNFNRIIFRCLNIGTRIRCIRESHIDEAFTEADKHGSSILSFANHDYRDMTNDLIHIKEQISKVKKKYPNVNICFSGAENAAVRHLEYQDKASLKCNLSIRKNVLTAEVTDGEIFGSQPFLAIKDVKGNYYHDNFDISIKEKKWTYVFDNQTIELGEIKTIAIGTAGRYGGFITKRIDLV
jgi:hypothetical protein